MASQQVLSPDVLKLDCTRTSKEIAAIIRAIVLKQLRKQGVVVALSGGVDSSVAGALCVQALGRYRVFGLLMPEKESSDDTLRLRKHGNTVF